MNEHHCSESVMGDVSQYQKTDKLQKALYLISETANLALNLDELYPAIHKIIGELIPAENLFFALYNEVTDTVHFPYYIDEIVKNPIQRQGKRGLTEYVIKTGQPLLVSPSVYAELLEQDKVEKTGVPAIDWMGVPLKTAQGKVIGVLAVQTYAEGIRYEQMDKEILTFVSTQVAMVVERKRAEEALREREEQYRVIVEQSHDGIYIYSEDKIVYANDKLCALLGVKSQNIDTINLLNYIHFEDKIRIENYIGQQTNNEKILPAIEARIINTQNQLKVIELNLTKIVYKGKSAFIGVVSDITERKAAEKLQNALYLISETIHSSTDLEKMYISLQRIIGELIRAENFFIAIYDENSDTVHFPYHVDEKDVNPGTRENGRGLTNYVIKTGQPLCVSQADHARMIREGKVDKSGAICVNWLGVPLKTAKNEVFGVLGVKTYKESIPYSQKDKDILSFVSNQVAMVIRRKQDEIRLQYLSFRDSLSGLYNRRYFEEEMRRMDKRREGSVGLIILDVDGLKLVNDIFGHDCGDIQLINVAKLLTGCFRERDVIARIGGDEYAILLHDADIPTVKAVCERVQKRILVGNLENNPPLSLSIGFAVSDDPSTPMRELFKQADNNMYREKLSHGQNARSAIVQTMMKLLEDRDFITEGHGDRVEKIVVDLAQKYELSEEKMANLRLFAQFHDVGKVGILNNILLKPGVLTMEEMQEMRGHSEIGHRIARSSPDLLPIADFILKHHEWWDGTGYPLGLTGTEIPLECRILAIADAYDAMTSDRPYRRAMSHETAIEELKSYAGVQFDPELIEKFIK
ncbi:HD domain-containing phosphohydrolase [Pelosinus sp. sgz500959]|uniref:HD domain-containing phosphohydrolase n=1 Tax=Pelosinus sp. sgz500959 TaxID=3242472 RepID=UPI00367333C7